MKVRVKATGEIVDVVITQRVTHTGEQVYMTDDGRLIEESRLEFNVDDTPDYWTRLKHQYAGMFVKSFLDQYDGSVGTEDIINSAIKVAHALVEKYKKEERK